MAETFDYIIVGAGSAGCVLAGRLAERRAGRILVLEAGGEDSHPLLAMPLGWFQAFKNPAFGWGYFTEPEPFADNRRIPAPRGKVVGGCSSINGMMYSRGNPADYDQWRQLGLPGWSFADVLPYFTRAEANWRGASETHGDSGPLTVSPHRTDDYVYPRLIAGAEQLGYPRLDDFHGASQDGFGVPDFSVHRGRRASTSRRYLRPALSGGAVTLVSRALVQRVLIEKGRAIGVVYQHDGTVHEVHAEGEVVLCGGTFNTPQLLMLSGIGPADELRDVGVTPVHDLPGVGRNLQDHASIAALYDANGPFTFDRELRLDRMAWSVLRWAITGGGPVGDLPVGAMGFMRTRPGLDRPDLQMLVSPVAMDSALWFPGWRKRRGDVFSVSNVLLHPESRGWVKLASADPAALPRVQLNVLSTENDRAAFRRFVRLMRDYFRTAPVAAMIKDEVLPGAAVSSDAEIDAYVRSRIGTAMHPVGTCAMGIGEDAVLDHEMRVRGVQSLRVVDCSAMPLIVGGNTHAPVVMMAEKAADLMCGSPSKAAAA